MTTHPEFHRQKLIELVLYVGAKCAFDQHYDVLKLNKILFCSDFLAFKKLGTPITGAEYRKYAHGPAPSIMRSLRRDMELHKDAFEYHNPMRQLHPDDEPVVERRLLPMRKPHLEMFSADEIAIVDGVIEWLRPKSGTEVSKMSHAHPGWILADMIEQEHIPYAAALLEDSPPGAPLSAVDLARAREVAARYASAGV